MAIKISKTEVTETDRTAFCQVNQIGVVKRNAYMTTQNSCRIPDTESVFFQGRLCDNPERVESINDKLLSNFFISIVDHSLVMQSKDQMIPTLFKMMQCYYLDNASVLETVLEQNLFEEWKTLRNGSPGANRNSASQTALTMQNSDVTDQGNQTLLSLMKNATRTVVSGFARLFQSKSIMVEEGSIILKLRVLKDLKLELLNKDFVGKSIRSLIRKGCLESRIKLKGPVLVTVYILSPEGEGKKEEIHFHLDLEASNHDAQQLRRAHEVHLQSQDIKLLVEEMDPIGLQRWIFDQLEIDINVQKRMNEVVSWQTLSRSDRMEILLDSLKMVDNGFNMLAQYCKENEPYVYECVFEKLEQLSSPEESDTDQNAELSYHKGKGLQKLYSMKLDLDIDEQAMSDQDLESDWESCLMDEGEENEYVCDKEGNKSCNGVEEEKFSGSGVSNKSFEKEGEHVELKELEKKSQDSHQGREMEEFENKKAKEKTGWDMEENTGTV